MKVFKKKSPLQNWTIFSLTALTTQMDKNWKSTLEIWLSIPLCRDYFVVQLLLKVPYYHVNFSPYSLVFFSRPYKSTKSTGTKSTKVCGLHQYYKYNNNLQNWKSYWPSKIQKFYHFGIDPIYFLFFQNKNRADASKLSRLDNWYRLIFFRNSLLLNTLRFTYQNSKSYKPHEKTKQKTSKC